MGIIDKYIQQTKDKNGEVFAFGFKGDIQNLIQDVENLEANMANKENFNALKEENILLHEIINKQNQALNEIEEILNTRHKPGHVFCDTRLPLILSIINKTKEQ